MNHRYWIVSSNVRSDRMHAGWRVAILGQHVAFMGWPPVADPQTPGEKMGTAFAREIQPRDAVLITYGRDRRLVAVARVAKSAGRAPILPPELSNHYWKKEKGRGYTSFKRFDRFLELDSDPGQYKISFTGTTGFGGRVTWALYELNPNQNSADADICRWMDVMLKKRPSPPPPPKGNKSKTKIRPTSGATIFRTVPIEDASTEDFFVMTNSASRRARRTENKLVNHFRNWLKKHRKQVLERAEYLPRGSASLLFSDGYVKTENLLIEAKSSSNNRNMIRLAIGQLLDYGWLHKSSGRVTPRLAILLPNQPADDIQKLLRSHKIDVIWKDRASFHGYPA